MTLITPLGDGAPADLLSETQELFESAVRRFSRIVAEIDDGDTSRAKEAVTLAKELRAALQTALDERTRVEKLRRQDAGIVHDYALDFDGARDEIGRRLARLRDAGSGG